MKKYVFITTLFALLTVGTFEAAKHTYKHFIADKTVVDITSLIKASKSISSIHLERSTDVSKEAKTSNLEKTLNTNHKIALNRFKKVKKIKRVVKHARKREENLSRYEIDNSELISIKAFEVPVIKTFVVASLLNNFALPVNTSEKVQLAQVDKPLVETIENVAPVIKEEKKNIQNKEDEIKLSMSATEKLNEAEEAMINELVNNLNVEDVAKERKEKKDSTDDEPLFFDYSSKKEIAQEKVNKKETKKEVVKQVAKKKIVTETVANNPLKEEVLSIDEAMNLLPKGKQVNLAMNTHKDVTTQKTAALPDYSQMIKSSLSSGKKNSQSYNAKLTVKTSLGIIDSGLERNAVPFQFVSDVSLGSPIVSGSIGAIEIEEQINERISTIRGTILSSETFPTIVELPLEYGDFLVNIPLLERSDVFKRFDGIRGAMLLIELDESTDSVDIDHKYVERILLNDRFKKVEEGDDYRFILYVGVEPGNTLIQYLTLNNEIGEKIVHLVEDHVFYESNTYIQSKKENIELYETKLLGKNDLELNIDSDDIRYFNTGIGSKAIGLNLYEVERPILPLGMRKYLELKHLGESIYAGYQDNKSIHVPSREYLNYVLDTFKIGDLQDRCLIQVNFDKNIVDMRVASESYKGPIGIETLYLDKDGMFNTEASDFAKKVFMIGDTTGTINLEVEYSDQSKDYIQTFCSSNTIIVEQL
ncbi:hypothetical protein BIY24_16245 [Halobacteriovorax marinus]|uniref:hypothetical protein n=1 Tax=Halobacteriovorax marinus TaxID=97084 RepID=UPI000BC2E753|nr:hypothetical protein [Halobacteriovorax marinus]ATH09435.1 hypothetical protein BIY24_16245 [Halobacteriovorax marinus]